MNSNYKNNSIEKPQTSNNPKQTFIEKAKILLNTLIAQKQYEKDCQVDKFNHYYSITKNGNRSYLPYIDIKTIKFKDYHINKQRIFAMNEVLMRSDKYIPLFITMTLKGQFAAFKKENVAADNGKTVKQDIYNWSDFNYDSFSLDDLKTKVENSYNELNKVNRKICQYVNKITNADFHYFTVFEPTKIFTFHTHSIFYIKQEHLSAIQTYLNKALSKVGRFEIKPLLKNENQVISNYVLKYVGKSFDGNNSHILGINLLSKFRIFRTSNIKNLGLINITDYKAIYKELNKKYLASFKNELLEQADKVNSNLFAQISSNSSIGAIDSNKRINIISNKVDNSELLENKKTLKKIILKSHLQIQQSNQAIAF